MVAERTLHNPAGAWGAWGGWTCSVVGVRATRTRLLRAVRTMRVPRTAYRVPRTVRATCHCGAPHGAPHGRCCLKGSLKEEVRREAARAGGDAVAQHYPLLMQKLADLVQDEGADGGGGAQEEGADGGGGVLRVSLERDAEMLSPKNGFVRAIKVRDGSRAVAEQEGEGTL